MEKFDIIKFAESMLDENKPKFIARDLKEVYHNLAQELRLIANSGVSSGAPIYSYDPKEESDQIMDMMEALALVYSWYACDSIKDL